MSSANIENAVNKVESLGKAIQQARMAKKMSQKELASKVNVKVTVIGDYESGKAVINAQIMNKIERELGVKLPRQGKKSVEAKKAAAGATAKTAKVVPV